MAKRKKLVTIDEAVEAPKQHTKPCSDCPWSRESLKGWLGGVDPMTWLREAGTDHPIPCHTVSNQQCAGAAIYRLLSMIRLAKSSTRTPQPGKTTVVEPNSSTMAGPEKASPAPSLARSMTGVRT